MKKLFIHLAFFRLLSPLFSGTLVYLLLLLINNTIDQLQETFFGHELYVCIALAYLIQEFARFALLLSERIKRPKSLLGRTLLQLVGTVVASMVLVSLAMYLYFKYVLFYTPNIRELSIFNSIFGFIALIYVVLYMSHQFLYRTNTAKLNKELEAKQAIEEDFVQFTKGINPELLFESLEAMLVEMKKNPDSAEALADHFSSVYRYILSKKYKELVTLNEELNVLENLVSLFNNLPYRKIKLKKSKTIGNDWIVPGSLLKIVESIIKTTIASEHQSLHIDIVDQEETLKIQYKHEEKLQEVLNLQRLQDIVKSYDYYSERSLTISHEKTLRIIELPKISFDESSYH